MPGYERIITQPVVVVLHFTDRLSSITFAIASVFSTGICVGWFYIGFAFVADSQSHHQPHDWDFIKTVPFLTESFKDTVSARDAFQTISHGRHTFHFNSRYPWKNKYE
jgi:hypothetical protein